MVIGFVLITLLMVTVLANASKAFLYYRSLASWADGAALVAAQSVAAEQIYAGELGGILPLSPGGAIDEVSAYAMRHDLADQFSDFAVASVDVDPSSGTVRVTLSARVPWVFANETTAGQVRGMLIRATATAVAPLSF